VLEVTIRKQAVLDSGCEFQVVLQRPLFVDAEAIEANSPQRIGAQPFFFDLALAGLAHTETAIGQASEGLVYLTEKVFEMLLRRGSGQGGFEPPPAFKQGSMEVLHGAAVGFLGRWESSHLGPPVSVGILTLSF
jgi:hypothetical protein